LPMLSVKILFRHFPRFLTYLLFIACNSTFTYKDKSVKIAQVSEDLGVRYVLEGSILMSAHLAGPKSV
jgi:TolB-like protein